MEAFREAHTILNAEPTPLGGLGSGGQRGLSKHIWNTRHCRNGETEGQHRERRA